jgi:hypothetical protein
MVEMFTGNTTSDWKQFADGVKRSLQRAVFETTDPPGKGGAGRKPAAQALTDLLRLAESHQPEQLQQRAADRIATCSGNRVATAQELAQAREEHIAAQYLHAWLTDKLGPEQAQHIQRAELVDNCGILAWSCLHKRYVQTQDKHLVDMREVMTFPQTGDFAQALRDYSHKVAQMQKQAPGQLTDAVLLTVLKEGMHGYMWDPILQSYYRLMPKHLTWQETVASLEHYVASTTDTHTVHAVTDTQWCDEWDDDSWWW